LGERRPWIGGCLKKKRLRWQRGGGEIGRLVEKIADSSKKAFRVTSKKRKGELEIRQSGNYLPAKGSEPPEERNSPGEESVGESGVCDLPQPSSFLVSGAGEGKGGDPRDRSFFSLVGENGEIGALDTGGFTEGKNR